MSTFGGIVDEYKLISIDCFRQKNYESSTYFLSHCHLDHMHGLRDENFWFLLQGRGFSKIYLSEVSEHLLKNDSSYSHLSEYLVGLPLEQPKLILIPDINGMEHSRVVVTLLTAGHCPGSVMFLIEGDNGRILYTGDFRLPIGSSARLHDLHDEAGCLKPLDSLYIDTTFCSRRYMFFPTREQCLDTVIPLVKTWLDKGSDHIIFFSCSAQYAYEFVFVELFKRFGEKTHVSEEKFMKYKGVKSIEDAVTHIPWDARIHACAYKKGEFKGKVYSKEAPCGYCTVAGDSIKVRKIKPSAMFFSKGESSNIAHYDTVKQMYRVCYSTHSSLAEQRDMVQYLKPKKVFPNVVNQPEKLILHLLQAPLSSDSSDSDSEQDISPLGPLKSFSEGADPINNTDSIHFYDECYKIPEDLNKDDIFLPKKRLPEMQFDSKKTKNSSNSSKNHQSIQCKMLNQSSEQHNSNLVTITSKQTMSSSSPLKWNFPSFSSDDENLDPNSSFSSSKDKSDSESINSSSQEQYIKLIDNKSVERAPSRNLTIISEENIDDSTAACFRKVQNKSELSPVSIFQNKVFDEIVSEKNNESNTHLDVSFSDCRSNIICEQTKHPTMETKGKICSQSPLCACLDNDVCSNSTCIQVQNSIAENSATSKQKLQRSVISEASEYSQMQNLEAESSIISNQKFQISGISNASKCNETQNIEAEKNEISKQSLQLREISTVSKCNQIQNSKSKFEGTGKFKHSDISYILGCNQTWTSIPVNRENFNRRLYHNELQNSLEWQIQNSVKGKKELRQKTRHSDVSNDLGHYQKKNSEIKNIANLSQKPKHGKINNVVDPAVKACFNTLDLDKSTKTKSELSLESKSSSKLCDPKETIVEKLDSKTSFKHSEQKRSTSIVDQPFSKTKSDIVPNTISDLLFSIYNSDSNDSDRLEQSNSWRDYKLSLDIETDSAVIHFSGKSQDNGSQKSALSAKEELDLLIDAINADNAETELSCPKLKKAIPSSVQGSNNCIIEIPSNSDQTKCLIEKSHENPLTSTDTVNNNLYPKQLPNTVKSKLSNTLNKNLSPNFKISSDENEIQLLDEISEKESLKLFSLSNKAKSKPSNSLAKSSSQKFVSSSSDIKLLNELNKTLNQNTSREFSCHLHNVNNDKSELNPKFNSELNEEVVIIDEKNFVSLKTCPNKKGKISNLSKKTEVHNLKSSFIEKIDFQTLQSTNCNMVVNSLNLSSGDEIPSAQNFQNVPEQVLYNSSLRFSSRTNSSSNSCKLQSPDVVCKQHQLDEYYLSKKHDTIFGPNFKKKKQSSSCTDSSEVICLNDISSFQKENPVIQIIDLSSDEDCDGEESGLRCGEHMWHTHKPGKSHIAVKSHSRIDIETDGSDVEVLDDSPSLIAPKFNVCDMASTKSSNTSSCVWKKRKSDEGSNLLSPKNPKLDNRSNSPDIFEENSEPGSTPEEFLLPTQMYRVKNIR